MRRQPIVISGSSEQMFAYRGRYFKWLLCGLLTFGLLAVAGCGGSDERDPIEVIDEWAMTLAEGDVEGAAELFALPSIAENGPVALTIETLEDAITFNQTLPCGAILQEAETTGSVTTATFELTDRPGGDCGQGTGGTAATSFVIEDGKIAEWRRVATEEERGGAPRGRET